jgi:drug/metabolite transporter (DMT)-like permease
VAVALVLLWPGQWRHGRADEPGSGRVSGARTSKKLPRWPLASLASAAREIKPESLKWFTYSGVSVCIAQMFIYMAYAVAPLSVVVPVLQLHHALRLVFSRLLNPQHEMFGRRMILATVLSLLGAVAISLDVEHVLAFVPLPESVAAFARWHWP